MTTVSKTNVDREFFDSLGGDLLLAWSKSHGRLLFISSYASRCLVGLMTLLLWFAVVVYPEGRTIFGPLAGVWSVLFWVCNQWGLFFESGQITSMLQRFYATRLKWLFERVIPYEQTRTLESDNLTVVGKARTYEIDINRIAEAGFSGRVGVIRSKWRFRRVFLLFSTPEEANELRALIASKAPTAGRSLALQITKFVALCAFMTALASLLLWRIVN